MISVLNVSEYLMKESAANSGRNFDDFITLLQAFTGEPFNFL